ncbi:hypothetical protein ACLB2K_004806 [Fragaria x ananassa]
MKARRTDLREANRTSRGEPHFARRTRLGEAKKTWRGEQDLARRNRLREVNITWRGEIDFARRGEMALRGRIREVGSEITACLEIKVPHEILSISVRWLAPY